MVASYKQHVTWCINIAVVAWNTYHTAHKWYYVVDVEQVCSGRVNVLLSEWVFPFSEVPFSIWQSI